jgi:serine/threonine protein kinase
VDDRYIAISQLGQGAFGVTIKAFDQELNQEVAVKIIKRRTEFIQQSYREIEILQHIDSLPSEVRGCIVRSLRHFMWRGYSCIVFELLSYSLLDLLEATQYRGCSMNLTRRFGLQLLEAVSTLHGGSRQVIHCDIKPENILLESRCSSALKLIDFGSSCFSDTSRVFSYVQSRYYRAPEVLLGLEYTSLIE